MKLDQVPFPRRADGNIPSGVGPGTRRLHTAAAKSNQKASGRQLPPPSPSGLLLGAYLLLDTLCAQDPDMEDVWLDSMSRAVGLARFQAAVLVARTMPAEKDRAGTGGDATPVSTTTLGLLLPRPSQVKRSTGRGRGGEGVGSKVLPALHPHAGTWGVGRYFRHSVLEPLSQGHRLAAVGGCRKFPAGRGRWKPSFSDAFLSGRVSVASEVDILGVGGTAAWTCLEMKTARLAGYCVRRMDLQGLP